jgi:hypothetical protein
MSDIFTVSGGQSNTASGAGGIFGRLGSPSGGDMAGAGGMDTLERTGRRITMLQRYAPGFVTSSPSSALALAEGGFDDDEMLRSATETDGFASMHALARDLGAEDPEVAYAMWAGLPGPLQESLRQIGYQPPDAPPEQGDGGGRFGINLPDFFPVDELTLPDEGVLGATLGNLQHAGGEILEGARDAGSTILAPFDWIGSKAMQFWRTGMYMSGTQGGVGFQNPLETASQASQAWSKMDEDQFYVRSPYISRARRQLNGDQTLYRLARAVAQGRTPEEMVSDFGFDPGSPEAGQLMIELTQAQSTPEFQGAVRTLSNGQLSFGRVVTQGMGLDDTSSGFGRIMSGTLDGGFSLIYDPTLVVGALSKGARFGRWAFTLEDSREIGRGTRMVDVARELHTARAGGAAAGLGRLESLRGAGRIGGTDINRGRAVLSWADRVAEGFSSGQLSRLMRDVPSTGTAIDPMMRSHLTRQAQGLAGLDTTDGVLDWLSNRDGLMTLAGTRLGGSSQLAHGYRIPALTRTDRAAAAARSWWTEKIDWARLQYGPGLRGVAEASGSGRYRRAAGQWLVAHTAGDAGRFITGLTTHAPYGRDHLPLVGNEAVEEFGRLVNGGVFARMDRPTMDAYIDAFAQGGLVERANQVDQFLTELFTRSGIADTPFAQRFLGRHRQVYATRGDDAIEGAAGETRAARLVDAQHADAMAIPELREFLRETRRVNFTRSVFHNTPSTWADAAIGRTWKPAVLMRIGFIPRAAGEELLHFALKHGPRTYLGGVGAHWAVQDELIPELESRLAEARAVGNLDEVNRLEQRLGRTSATAAPLRSLLAAGDRMYLRAFDGLTSRAGLDESTSAWRRRLANKREALDDRGVVGGLERMAVQLSLRQAGLLEWGAEKLRIPTKGQIGEFLAERWNPGAMLAARSMLENPMIARAYAEQISGSTFTPDEFRGMVDEAGRPLRRVRVSEMQAGRPAVREVELRPEPGHYRTLSRGLEQDPSFMDSLYQRHQRLKGDRAGQQVLSRVLPRWVGGDVAALPERLGVPDAATLRGSLNDAWAWAPPEATDEAVDPDVLDLDAEDLPEDTRYSGRQLLSAVRGYLDGEEFEGGRRRWLATSLTRLFDDAGTGLDGEAFLNAIDESPGAAAHWLAYENVDPSYLIDDFGRLRRAMAGAARSRIARPDMYRHLREMRLYAAGDQPLASPVAEGISKVYVPMTDAPLGALGDDFVEAFVARARTIGGFGEDRLREIGQRMVAGSDSNELRLAASNAQASHRPVTTWGHQDPRLADAAMAAYEQVTGHRATFGILEVEDAAVQRSAGRMNAGLRSDTPNWQTADGFEIAPWRLVHTRRTDQGRRLVTLDVDGEAWDEIDLEAARAAHSRRPPGTRRFYSGDRGEWSEEIPDGPFWFVDVPTGDPRRVADVLARNVDPARYGERLPVTELGMATPDPALAPTLERWRFEADPDTFPSREEDLDITEVVAGQEGIDPNYAERLSRDPDAYFGDDFGEVADEDRAASRPQVLRLPDGRLVLPDGHHRAAGEAARSGGRFRARVFDVAEEPGDDLQSRIAAVAAESGRDWVSLAEVRRRLPDVPRDELDAALRAMHRSGNANLVPEANRKALTDEDRAASLRVGGEDKELLSVTPGAFGGRLVPGAPPAPRRLTLPPDEIEAFQPRRLPAGAAAEGWEPEVWGREVSEGLPEITALERVADGTVGETVDLLTTFNRSDLDDDVLHELVEPLLRPARRRIDPDTGEEAFEPGYTFEHLVYGTPVDRLPWESYGPEMATARDSTWAKVVQEWFGGPVDQAISSVVRRPMFLTMYGQELARQRGLADLFVEPEVLAAARAAGGRLGLDDDALDTLAMGARHEPVDGILAAMTEGQDVDPDDLGAIRDFVTQRDHGLRTIEGNALNRAVQLVTPFIDDSRIRSQFQQYVGGFVPFMHAEEQFLKRWTRSILESPEMIRKAQLTMNGIRNMGVVRQDEQGNEVFVFPGAGAAADTLADLAAPIFGDNVRLPYAIQMTGQVGYTLPGLGDQVGTPSVGPLVAAPLEWMSRHFPELNAIERPLLDRSADQPMWRYFVPSHGANLWEAAYGDIDQGQLASAVTQAMLTMAANGQAPPETATPAERQEFIDRARGQARFILGVRAAFGMQSPAAPQVRFEHEDLAEEWNRLLAAADIEDATTAFLAAHPDADIGSLLATTVRGSEQEFGGMGTPIAEAFEWMRDNESLVEGFPGAASWLMPEGDSDDPFDQRAYQQQLAVGLRHRKAPEELLNDIYWKAAAHEYFEARQRHEEAMLTLTGQQRSQAQSDWDRWRAAYFAQHPVFEQMLADPQRSQRRQQAVSELQVLSRSEAGPVPGPMRDLINRYDDYRAATTLMRGDRRQVVQNRREDLTQEFTTWALWHLESHPSLKPLYMQLIEPDLMEVDEDGVAPGALSEERLFA